MSSYLNNLVTRQLNVASLVQPRLPSLFEPPSQVSAQLHERRGTREPLAVEMVEAEMGVDARPQTKHSIETAADWPAARFHSSLDETAHTVWRGQQQIASSSWPFAETTSDKADKASTQIAAPQFQTASSPSGMTPTTAANMTPLSSAALEEAAAPQQNVRKASTPLGAAIEQQDKTNEQPMSPRPERSTSDSVPVKTEGVESTKSSLAVQPRVVLLVENRREADDSSLPIQPHAPAEPSPVINVTIGRIEVRAASPSTTPHSQPSAKPLMSLDEYLRRRTKGGGQ